MLDPIAGRLEHYMDLLALRQKLTASNIANADTPGYHTKDIDFQAEFQAQVEAASLRSPEITEVDGLKIRNDGNDVSLDREARLLSENAIRFNLVSTLWKGELRSMRSAIQEGRS